MPREELVSVVICTQRRPLRFWDALRGVGEQTYTALEVVVVNDGGPPVTAAVAHFRAAYRRPITVIDLPTAAGSSNARNTGMRAATGPLIALLDDDDRYRPTHVARLAAALRAHPEAALAYDDVLIQVEEGAEADAPGRVTATCRFGRGYDQAVFDHDDFIVPSASLFRREIALGVGGFDVTLPQCEDWDFLLRVRQRGGLLYVPGMIGVDYSLRPTANDNRGSQFDGDRLAALERLTTRYGLPKLVPKTFLDVARDLGFTIVPV